MDKQRNILIIGASSEIAQAIIQKLNKTSYTLVTTSRAGVETDFTLDLTSAQSIGEFESGIQQKSFDWILYCAGLVKAQESTERFTSEYAVKSERVNFTAAAQLLTALTPQVKKGGGILALSSTAGIWGNPFFPLYSSWKGALNTFLQSLHKHMEESDRYVFSICPGPTNTQMRQTLAGDAEKQQSPDVVAHYIVGILENPKKYKDSPVIVIRDKNLYRLNQELIQFQKE